MTRVAVTGANGRLGRAVVAELERRGLDVVAWSRPDYDLDDPAAAERLVARDAPDAVIHCAAWTDVDGCARDPELAMRRNGAAAGELAEGVARRGGRMLLISTNEVFDGERTDGKGYVEDDPPNPINPYGESKLGGERLAAEALDRSRAGGRLTIVRTSWLYGPPGNDFPTKIIEAADRLAPGEPLRVVTDEIGSPTYTLDLAPAVVDLALMSDLHGIVHVANAGHGSRFDAAKVVLDVCRPDIQLAPITRVGFVRPSRAPAWAVMQSARAKQHGLDLPDWLDSLRSYAHALCAGVGQ